MSTGTGNLMPKTIKHGYPFSSALFHSVRVPVLYTHHSRMLSKRSKVAMHVHPSKHRQTLTVGLITYITLLLQSLDVSKHWLKQNSKKCTYLGKWKNDASTTQFLQNLIQQDTSGSTINIQHTRNLCS